MKKRLFAALLALVLLISALPVTAMAATAVSDVKLGETTELDYATLLRRSLSYTGGMRNFTTGGGMQVVPVGESGSKTTLPLSTNKYTGVESVPSWYGVPASGSVIVSNPGIIGNCTFELDWYRYKGHNYAGIRFNYDVLKEGTTVVQLTYYVNFTTKGYYDSWNEYHHIFTISSGTPEKPGQQVNNVHDGDDNAVLLMCDDNDNTKDSGYPHDQVFSEIAPEGITGTYTVSSVMENDGHELKNTTRYPWMCKVTVNGQPFVDYYNAQGNGTQTDIGEHYLTGATSKYFYMYYDALDVIGWSYIPSKLPVTFQITKTAQSMKDITLTYDGGSHEGKVTGLPDPRSETKSVNVDGNAGFVVSSAKPTCSCGEECVFLGWKLDGNDHIYKSGDSIELSQSATLHAVWNDSATVPPAKPDPGKFGGDVYEDYGDGTGKTWRHIAVHMSCATAAHVALYRDITDYPETYSLGNVVANDGTHAGFAKDDYPWMCEMTVSANEWLKQYHADYKDEVGEHTLVDNEPATQTVYWFYSSNGVWTYLKSDAPVKINIKHQDSGKEDLKPDPNGPTEGTVENLLKKKSVQVLCDVQNTEHASSSYSAENGWVNKTITKKDGGFTVGQTTYDAAYEITLSSDEFVKLYSDATTGTGVSHTRVEAKTGETLTWIVYWDPAQITDNKWVLSDNNQSTVYTVHDTEPTTPPTDDNIKNALNGKEVTVDCVTTEGEHQDKTYDAELGLTTDAPVKLTESQLEGKAYKTAYSITLSAQKFVDLYSKSTEEGGTGVAHTQKANTAEKLTWIVYWDASAKAWAVDQNDQTTVQVEHTVTPQQYTVTFDCQATTGVENAPDAQTVTAGGKATVPTPAPSRKGYNFVGWYKDLNDANAYDFNTPVNSNFTLYAKWTPKQSASYTVKYLEQNTNTQLHEPKSVTTGYYVGDDATEDAITINGYTPDKTSKTIKLTTGTNEIIFYYTKNNEQEPEQKTTYTVRYLKENTTTALLPESTSPELLVGSTVTVYAPAIDGYTCVSANPQTITLKTEAAENIVTFYYKENTNTIPAGEPAKEPFNKNANPRQLNRDDHFAYIKGYPDGTVHPEASLTRAEAAAILYRVMEPSCVEKFHADTSSFRDVPAGKWYTTYVATLEKAGVIVDSKDGDFRPNDAITRAELASMLARFANVTGGTTSFSDVPAAHWAADYIAAAVRSGWITGYPDGTFRPEQTIKRAEMVAMVNRALGRDPQSADALLPAMKTWTDNADAAVWYYLDIQEATNGHTYARKTGGEYWTGLLADTVS